MINKWVLAALRQLKGELIRWMALLLAAVLLLVLIGDLVPLFLRQSVMRLVSGRPHPLTPPRSQCTRTGSTPCRSQGTGSSPPFRHTPGRYFLQAAAPRW